MTPAMPGEKKDKSYGFAPDEAPPPAPPADVPAKDGESKPESKPEPSAAIRALDVCPNCAAPLGGVDAVVCLRCGFDMKTLKVLKTATGTKDAPPAPEPQEEAAPLSRPGSGDLWLPAVIALGSLVLLCVGDLAGWGGLFGGAETVGFGARISGLFKMSARTAVWTVAGVGGLAVLANILSTRIGDLTLASVRVLAIIAAASVLTVIDFSSLTAEWALQVLLQAAAFVGLAIALLRLSARDAAMLLGVTVMFVVVLALSAALVLWAAPPV